MKKFTGDQLREQIEVILRHWGMSEADIETTATVMVDTDLSGIDSHGISMLMTYDKLVQDERINTSAQSTIVRETPAIAVLDADRGLGHPVAVRAMKLAIEKAKSLGIGAVAVGNADHFGAAGYYVRLAAAQGLIGLATTSGKLVTVVPTGGAAPALMTNPIAFAAPSERGEPFVLDMATSAVALNKIKSYVSKEKDLPVGWVVDDEGQPITDSAAAYAYVRAPGAAGGLVPVGGSSADTGGHKGYGLSVMVQILSAALSNAALPGGARADGENIGNFFLALDPELFNPGAKAPRYVADLVDYLHGIAPIDAQSPVLVAGDLEASSRIERSRSGVPVPDLLLKSISEVCSRNGVPFLLEPQAAQPQK